MNLLDSVYGPDEAAAWREGRRHRERLHADRLRAAVARDLLPDPEPAPIAATVESKVPSVAELVERKRSEEAEAVWKLFAEIQQRSLITRIYSGRLWVGPRASVPAELAARIERHKDALAEIVRREMRRSHAEP